jgi:hypothetical protein
MLILSRCTVSYHNIEKLEIFGILPHPFRSSQRPGDSDFVRLPGSSYSSSLSPVSMQSFSPFTKNWTTAQKKRVMCSLNLHPVGIPGFVAQGNRGWRSFCHLRTWLNSIKDPRDSYYLQQSVLGPKACPKQWGKFESKWRKPAEKWRKFPEMSCQ